jgi:hypothetical protein
VSDTDIRKWALASGRSVPARGPLSQTLRDDYALEHDDLEPSDADFDVIEPGPPPADAVEKKPRTIATPRAGRFAFGGKKPPRKKGPGKKRVALDSTIASVWGFLGGLAKPLPATSRLLKFQAPAAGKILEPIVKDTMVDRILQPLARTTEGAEAVAVLIGTPALVTMMQLQPQIIPFGMPLLRDLMLRMVKIAGPSMAEAMKAEHEFEAEYGGTVDDLIGMLFAGVFEESEPMTAEDEEAAIRRAQEAVQNVAAA